MNIINQNVKCKFCLLLIIGLIVSATNFSKVFAAVLYTENLIPAMISNEDSNGKCTASGYQNMEKHYPYKSFDHLLEYDTAWQVNDIKNVWIQYEFKDSKKITKYTLAPMVYNGPGATRMCKSWKLQGSNDGINYTDLDTRSNIADWAEGVKKEFTFENNNSYKMYRVFIISNNGDLYTTGIGEIEMMETQAPLVPTLDIISSTSQVLMGNEFNVNVSLHNVNNIYAEDITIKYNSTLFDYVSVEPSKPEFEVYPQNSGESGTLRFIVANKGQSNGITGESAILKLTFKAKTTAGIGKIEPSYGLIADGYNGSEKETVNIGTSIEVIGGNPDVNKDGKYSLGDLAIDSRHFNMDRSNWDSNYDVDIIINGNIDDSDLQAIVAAMLESE